MYACVTFGSFNSRIFCRCGCGGCCLTPLLSRLAIANHKGTTTPPPPRKLTLPMKNEYLKYMMNNSKPKHTFNFILYYHLINLILILFLLIIKQNKTTMFSVKWKSRNIMINSSEKYFIHINHTWINHIKIYEKKCHIIDIYIYM